MPAAINALLLLVLLPSSAYAEDCLEPADPNGRDVPFANIMDSSSSLPSKSQIIIASYKFSCKGNIVRWWTYIIPNNPSELSYTFTFQVWRPSKAVEVDGCYRLIGENTFHRISVSSDGLVRGDPDESETIAFSPGDVVGYYAYSSSSDTSNGGGGKGIDEPRIRLDEGYINETVWYHTNTKNDPLTSGPDPCFFATGSQPDRTLQSFTRAAPVLSLDIVPQTPFPLPTTTILGSTDAKVSPPTLLTDIVSSTFIPPLFSLTYPDVSSVFIPPYQTPIPPAPFTPSPPTLKLNLWIIIAIAVASALFILLLILILITIIVKRRKRKQQQQQKEDIGNDPSEPIYAEIDEDRKGFQASMASEDVEVVGIEVVANESYAMLASNSLVIQHYGTVGESDAADQEKDDTT